MLNTSIHDSAVARLSAQSSRSRNFEDVLAAADAFVSAAALYLTAHATKSAGAPAALVQAGERYGALIYANEEAFDLTTDTGFANVAKTVDDVRATSHDMPARWAQLVDSYTGSDMDDVHVVVI